MIVGREIGSGREVTDVTRAQRRCRKGVLMSI